MKKYYYLEGPDKKGPFTEDEFINLNLDHDTLIWTEGLENWKPLKEFPDLLKVIPPPLPEEVLPKPPAKKKSKKVGYSFLVLFVLLAISFGVGYGIVESKKSKFKEDLTDRVDRIFNGKSIICDGVKYRVEGELTKVTRPVKSTTANYDLTYSSRLQEYEQAKSEGIIEKFTCTSGGFTFKKLKKIDLGFELEVIQSTNLGFLNNYYYRGTVQEGYNSAFEYIVEENSGCYSSGYYEVIENFQHMSNDYYYIKNTEKPSSPYAAHWWSSGEGNIYNNSRKVYYKTDGWYYEISERKWKIEEDYILFFSIGGGLSLLIFIILLSANPFKW